MKMKKNADNQILAAKKPRDLKIKDPIAEAAQNPFSKLNPTLVTMTILAASGMG